MLFKPNLHNYFFLYFSDCTYLHKFSAVVQEIYFFDDNSVKFSIYFVQIYHHHKHPRQNAETASGLNEEKIKVDLRKFL